MKGQKNELNIGFGYAYYFGDLNIVNSESSVANPIIEGGDIKNFRASYSLGYRYNFKNHFSIGLNYYFMNLAGYDSDNKSTVKWDAAYSRLLRNLSFHTQVHQSYIDVRFEPFKIARKWDTAKWHFSPYLSAGIGMFQFNPKAFYNGVEYELQPLGTEGQGLPGYKDKYNLSAVCIPVGFGFKMYGPKEKFAISLDLCYSYTNTDYIDDVSGNYANGADFNKAYSADKARLVNDLAIRNLLGQSKNIDYNVSYGEIRGNANNNDHFMTGQIKFSYDLGGSNKYYRPYRTPNVF
jgi:hypothetical protein